MFIFDVETLGKKSNAAILSMACIFFNPDEKPTPQELRDSAFFVKLNAEDQMKRLKRSITKSSIDWWAKQCLNVKNKSFFPHPNDVTLEDGLEQMRQWSKQYGNSKKTFVWARGNLDQLVLDDAEEQLGIEPIFHYNRWRDVRTAVDFLYDSDTGYCKVDYPNFDPALHITKHDPIDDCVYDVMMMIYGVKNGR
jgi:hypothetical protein